MRWIILVIFIIIIPLFFKFCSNKEEKIDNPKIDSIYIVKDSIINKIDTVYYKINNINEEFKKDLDIINNNITDDNYLFFIEYINTNKGRLDSLCNTSTN